MYYKISEDGTSLERVGLNEIDVPDPTASDYANIGAYPKRKSVIPYIPSDGIASRAGYFLDDENYWQERWVTSERPPYEKVYSSYKFYLTLRGAGVWPQVKASLEDNDLWDAFLIADNFREDDQIFQQIVANVQTVIDYTDDQFTALLAQSISD